ncbi:MAG: hypothetical protein BMS9Abin06_0947 [Gammaproteobacteria bacterium]|nr:MAG: hypothetical protein BMS9Abin06_0947 [Gammaproteobacteria bacterium]
MIQFCGALFLTEFRNGYHMSIAAPSFRKYAGNVWKAVFLSSKFRQPSNRMRFPAGIAGRQV